MVVRRSSCRGSIGAIFQSTEVESGAVVNRKFSSDYKQQLIGPEAHERNGLINAGLQIDFGARVISITLDKLISKSFGHLEKIHERDKLAEPNKYWL
jgi:hypothetical protein